MLFRSALSLCWFNGWTNQLADQPLTSLSATVGLFGIPLPGCGGGTASHQNGYAYTVGSRALLPAVSGGAVGATGGDGAAGFTFQKDTGLVWYGGTGGGYSTSSTYGGLGGSCPPNAYGAGGGGGGYSASGYCNDGGNGGDAAIFVGFM